MKRAVFVLGIVVLAACPKSGDKKPVEPVVKRDAGSTSLAPDDSAPLDLPPAPPLPALPLGLPQLEIAATVTPERVALGELLFWDARLSSTGKVSCATCHDPRHGWSGTARQAAADGKPNLRRAPAIANLAWATELAWDGRYATLDALLDAHVRGQLGNDLAAALARVKDLPLYRAQFARVFASEADKTREPINAGAAQAALAAYISTRYDGDSPWDRRERSDRAPADAAMLDAGYQLFTHKAQCSVCHTPPLYTDGAYHRLGLIAVPDEGRGRVDPKLAGAFRTPSLRGATHRPSLFHDGSATSLDAAIDWHLAGGTGQGADPSIVDVKKVTLTREERAQLGAFVTALTRPIVTSSMPPLP